MRGTPSAQLLPDELHRTGKRSRASDSANRRVPIDRDAVEVDNDAGHFGDGNGYIAQPGSEEARANSADRHDSAKTLGAPTDFMTNEGSECEGDTDDGGDEESEKDGGPATAGHGETNDSPMAGPGPEPRSVKHTEENARAAGGHSAAGTKKKNSATVGHGVL